MANMSYCRMENTLHDLRDVEEHLGDRDLSVSERQARENLVALCVEIAQRWGDVELDEDDEEDDDDGSSEDEEEAGWLGMAE